MADIYFRPDGPNRFQIRSAAELPLPSAWLDQEFNRIYTYLNTIEGGGATTGSEWSTVSAEATQASTTSFTVEGDYSDTFEVLRAIQFTDDSDSKTQSHIKSVSYVGGTNLTTVTVYDAVVPATIKQIDVGLIGSEAQPIPAVSYTTRNSGYTVGALDQIIFVDDSTIGNLIKTWDDGATGGDETSYYALWITLPSPGDMQGKLLCVKKIAGTYRTIVAAHATRTDTTVGDVTTHNYTYDFQLYGDSSAKTRVTLKGIGDCYWLVSNGSRWYELTPESSESVKGIVRLATEAEMSLTAQQIADSETLSRTLAVSPYQADKVFLRSDASNLSFASNYIYKSPNGVAAIVNNQIVVASGLGLNCPNGRDSNGVIKTKKLELSSNITYGPTEVSDHRKVLFVHAPDDSHDTPYLVSIFARNYQVAPAVPFFADTTSGDELIWYDTNDNLLRYSTDNGTNWTTFDGCGPICQYYGNGSYTTAILQYGTANFLTRYDACDILRRTSGFMNVGGAFQIASGWKATINGLATAYRAWGDGNLQGNHDMWLYVDGVAISGIGTGARDGRDGYWHACISAPVKAGQTVTVSAPSTSGVTLSFIPDIYTGYF